jgi:bHLH factor
LLRTGATRVLRYEVVGEECRCTISGKHQSACTSTVPSNPPQQSVTVTILRTGGTPNPPGSTSTSPSRGRGRGGTAKGSKEWTRQRKDNHVFFLTFFLVLLVKRYVALTSFFPQKEVERRRRGNINEGINELGRIVPSDSGEKAKGAILSRTVQYIHHLKEKEVRNTEKRTLEKLRDGRPAGAAR